MLINTVYGRFHMPENSLWSKLMKKFGHQSRPDLEMVLSFIQEGDIIFDIGAHIGTFAIPMASKVGDRGHIYAFEAHAGCYSWLNEHVQLNEKHNIISTYLSFVTDKPANLTLFEQKIVEVKEENCLALDEWYEALDNPRKVNLIKVDVEGADLNVLRSATKIIRKDKPIIYVEVHKKALAEYGNSVNDLEKFLRELGYHFFRNIGKSTSGTKYVIGRLQNLRQGGEFYNLLAIHSDSTRYPTSYKGGIYMAAWLSVILPLKRMRGRLGRRRKNKPPRVVFSSEASEFDA